MLQPGSEPAAVPAAAAEPLRRGEVVAFPTDTVVGLGCRMDSQAGIATIFRLKGRDADRPLTLFVGSIRQAEEFTGPLPARVRTLLERCWPGALTAVLPCRAALPEGVGKSGTVGLRMPAHPVPQELVRLAGIPLATTSANRSGEQPLANAEDARALWGRNVFVVPGVCGSVPSTVADFAVWPPKVLRAGALSGADLLRFSLESFNDRARLHL